MSADFARARDHTRGLLTPSIFDFRVDCPREIDFDFFDATPSSSTSSLSPSTERAARTGEDYRETNNNTVRQQSGTREASDDESDDVIAYVPPVPPRVDHERGGDDPNGWGTSLSPRGPHKQAEEQQDPPASRKDQRKGLLDDHNSEQESCQGLAGGQRLPVTDDRDPAGSRQRHDESDSGGVQDTIRSPCRPYADEAPLGITDLVMVPKRARQASAASSMTGVSSAPSGPSSSSSEAEDPPDPEAVAVATLTGALRCLRPPSSTRSYASTMSKRSRSSRINMSFSNDEARRIQRENEILLRRIVAQKARAAVSPQPCSRPCSHAINRGRRSRDIQRENEILLKKIQAVKRSASQLSMVSRSSSAMSGRV